jgi:hypothetical protein
VASAVVAAVAIAIAAIVVTKTCVQRNVFSKDGAPTERRTFCFMAFGHPCFAFILGEAKNPAGALRSRHRQRVFPQGFFAALRMID